MTSKTRVLGVLNPRVIEALELPPKPKQWLYIDRSTRTGIGGSPTKTLAIHVSYSGTRTFRVVWYEPKTGKMRSAKLGRWPEMSIGQARKAAKDFDPKAFMANEQTEASKPEPDSVEKVARRWVKLVVEGDGHLTGRNTVRLLEKHVLPAWGKLDINSIRRKIVHNLLDEIASEFAKSTADACLRSVISPLLRWHADRDEDFVLPLGKNMRRDKRPSSEKSRDRVLADHEIRALWRCTDDGTAYSGMLRLALLSGQRIDRLLKLKHSDIRDGIWRQKPESDRSKGVPADLRLGPMALEVVASQNRFEGSDYVFSVGAKPLTAIGYYKARMDARMRKELGPEMERFTTHDLRRSWRSLASRARVNRVYSESVLGHSLKGVEQIYDRHDPSLERGEALLAVENLIKGIIDPRETNVIRLPERAEAVQ